MATSHRAADLKNLPTRLIEQNPDNPRLIFRPAELQDLAASIQDHGVQVPISVFKSGGHYRLIDGERRWRACQQLNIREIPAIIYPEPTPVQNIVFMFNIHRFRKDWDPLPTAMKLEELKVLVQKEEGRTPTEPELAALTGMSRGAVRRCKLIMEIPPRDRAVILRELEKPAAEQRLTTDLFIETQRAVRTIGSYFPEHSDLEKPLRDVLIDKYKKEVIVNVVHMRLVARIARAASKGVAKPVVLNTLRRLIDDPRLSVEDAYSRIAWVYEVRAIENQAKSLSALLESLPQKQVELTVDVRHLLKDLVAKIGKLLRAGD